MKITYSMHLSVWANLTRLLGLNLRLPAILTPPHIMKHTIGFILFILSFLVGHSQSACFTKQNTYKINCFFESPTSIWIGTKEDGLLQWDKQTETVIAYNDTNAQLASNHIRSITSFNNAIIFSADSGIYKVDGNDFTLLIDSISGELGISPEGNLMIASDFMYYEWDSNGFSYQKDLFELVTFSCPICEGSSDLILDENGHRWITHHGFYEFDILEYDGTNWELHDVNTTAGVLPIESFNEYNSLMAYDQKIQATAYAPYTFKNSEWKYDYSEGNYIVTLDNDTLVRAITDLEPDVEKGYWVGTFYSSLAEDSTQVAYVRADQSFIFNLPDSSDLTITKIHSSLDGKSIFIGTDFGLFQLDKTCLDLPTQVPEILPEIFSFYPNPVIDYIHFKKPVKGELSLLDINGKLVKSYPAGLYPSIDMSALQTGAYLLNIKTENGSIQAIRLIKSAN
jgi:hypothetical protein